MLPIAGIPGVGDRDAEAGAEADNAQLPGAAARES
jgi:hypothetical protein